MMLTEVQLVQEPKIAQSRYGGIFEIRSKTVAINGGYPLPFQNKEASTSQIGLITRAEEAASRSSHGGEVWKRIDRV